MRKSKQRAAMQPLTWVSGPLRLPQDERFVFSCERGTSTRCGMPMAHCITYIVTDPTHIHVTPRRRHVYLASDAAVAAAAD